MLEPEDLLSFGMIPSLSVVCQWPRRSKSLDEEALVRILTEPRNALVKQYQRLFEMEEVFLKFTDGALAAIAREAIRRKTGARGLRAILEEIALDVMYDPLSRDNIQRIIRKRSWTERKTPSLFTKTRWSGPDEPPAKDVSGPVNVRDGTLHWWVSTAAAPAE